MIGCADAPEKPKFELRGKKKEKERKKKKIEETTGQKYNDLPYSIGRP